jgi:wyosine [tRNA(Phe)-imidazoG37] synthetase (radical SAM superfamily)
VAKIHAEEIIEIIRDLSDEHDTSIEFATRAMLISQIALLRKEIENTREFLRFTL